MEGPNENRSCINEGDGQKGQAWSPHENRHITLDESFQKFGFQNPRDVKQQVIKLKAIRTTLSNKFLSLSIQQTISKDYVPFIHIWKPISQSNGVQGMPFLPCFHIIVTLTTFCDDPKAVKSKGAGVLFQLHSFHGKVLAEENICLKSCGASTHYDLVSRMADDRLRMCRGIEELDAKKFADFIQCCEQPLLRKIRSILLIEQFMGEIVLRSRLCYFVLYNIEDNHEDDFVQCKECLSYQNQNQETTTGSFENLEATKHEEIKSIRASSEMKNEFQRVFDEAFVTDLETMEVLQKVRRFYVSENTNITEDVTGTKPESPIKTEIQGNICVKSEPNEPTSSFEHSNGTERTFKSRLSSVEPANDSLKEKVVFENSSYALKAGGNGADTSLVETYALLPHGGYVAGVNITNHTNDFAKKGHNYNSDLIQATSELKQNKKKTFSSYSQKKLELKSKSKNRISSKKTEHKTRKTKVREEKKKPKTFNETCAICLKKYDNEFQYNQDQGRHAQAFDLKLCFTCPLCEQIIDNKYLVTSHFDKVHYDQNVTCCCECALVIPKGSNRLRRHILKFHHTAGEKLVCPDCGKEYSGIYRLEMHQAEEHGEKKEIICHHCGRSWAHEKSLKDHLRKYHQPHLQCPHKTCDKTFGNRTQAIRHLNVHSGIKPYKCAQCEYMSYRETNVATHFEKSHGKKKTRNDMIVDVVERDRMLEIARKEVNQMIKDRQLKLKKEELEDIPGPHEFLEKTL